MDILYGIRQRLVSGVESFLLICGVRNHFYCVRARFLFISFIITLIQTPVASPANLKGAFGSELYAWEAAGKHHLRPYESLQANLLAWHGAGNKALSFYSYLRWTSDFRDKFSNDPSTYIYDSYLKLTGVPRGSTLSLGRQFVYSGAGSALLDGMRIHCDLPVHLKIDFFGGGAVSSSNPDRIQSFARFGVIGGSITRSPTSYTHYGLEWLKRKSDGQTSFSRASLYGEGSVRNLTLYGRLSCNLFASRLAEILTRATYSYKYWYTTAEFNWREPSVASNSLFSIIDFHNYRQIRLEVQRTIRPGLAVVGRFHVTILKGEDSWRASMGINTKKYSLGWQGQQGYGGNNNGVYGNLRLQLNQRWQFYSNISLSRYRVQEMQVNQNDAYFTNAGILWRAFKGTDIRLEGQYLRNAAQKNDYRVYVRLTEQFSFGHSSEEVTP